MLGWRLHDTATMNYVQTGTAMGLPFWWERLRQNRRWHASGECYAHWGMTAYYFYGKQPTRSMNLHL